MRTVAALCLLALAAPSGATSARPPLLERVGIEPRLGEELPLDLAFRDHSGRAVRLGDYFGQKPVLLSLAYFRCPMLCTEVLNGLARALNALALVAGRDFTVLTVSFDPTDTAADAAIKRAAFLQRSRHGRSDWHFLTGEPEAIRRLTERLGFRFARDAARGEFAHGAAIFAATPSGRIARYFYGVEYSPRDLRLGLVEASEGRIGTLSDQILLFCFHYDPATGKYSALALGAVRLGGVATVVGLGAFMLVMWRRERKSHG